MAKRSSSKRTITIIKHINAVRDATDAMVVVIHPINHCLLLRDELWSETEDVYVSEDGEKDPLEIEASPETYTHCYIDTANCAPVSFVTRPVPEGSKEPHLGMLTSGD